MRDERTRSGLSLHTLLIAGAASAAAALLIPLLWEPGTLFAAAMTPIIVAVAFVTASELVAGEQVGSAGNGTTFFSAGGDRAGKGAADEERERDATPEPEATATPEGTAPEATPTPAATRTPAPAATPAPTPTATPAPLGAEPTVGPAPVP